MTFALLLVVMAPRPVGAQAADAQDVGLAIGESLFWDGEHVPVFHGGVATGLAYFAAPPEAWPITDPCVNGTAYCRLYELDVIEPGGTLRIAMDSSTRGDCYGFEVRDPSGARPLNTSDFGPGGFEFACSSDGIGGYTYNLETIVPDAATGTWQVRALAFEVEDWAFRMRATLEDVPHASEPHFLAPNLVPWLPSEFGFRAPASPFASGESRDRLNPPGPPGISCMREEAPQTKCLRFSAGVHVTGDGPLYMVFRDEQAFQHVYLRDETSGDYRDNEAEGNYEEFEAGPVVFDNEHNHVHFEDMVLYELFAVSDPSGPEPHSLTALGTGKKIHACFGVSQGFANWFDFEQDDRWTSIARTGNCSLVRGWGDVYRWQRGGQYVPYDQAQDPDGTMRAGLYVVRVTVDPNDLLQETSEIDNAGYAYIRVIDGALPHSDRVVVCERGFGDSPWDPTKEIVDPDPHLWAQRLKDPSFVPETC